MKKILVIVLVVIVSLAAGAGGAFVMAKGSKAKQTVEVVKPKKTVAVKLGERTINLADTDAAHYIRLTLVLQMTGSGDKKAVEKDYMADLMDTEITVTSKYTYRLLLTSTGKQSLKKELCEGFNAQLKDSGWVVSDVLTTDLLME